MPRCLPVPAFPSLLKKKIQPLLLLFIFISADAISQQQENEKNTDRVNACFTASRTETGENLCLFYNHLFTYYLTYGALDQYAKGSYRCSNDTVYLNSKAAPAFTITAGKNDAIPNDKIKLLFKNPGNNAGYIAWATGDAAAVYVDKLKKTSSNYSVTITRAASIALQHILYDKTPVDYALDKNKNEFSIAISDSLGMLAFDNEPFVWEGNALKAADPGKKKVFTLAAAAPLSYEEMHWNDNEPKPGKEAFEAWSRQQDDLFRKRAAAALELEAAKEQALKKEMLLHFENDWQAAVQKARQDTAAIILLLGVDSIKNSTDTAAGQLYTPENRKTGSDYYNSFTQYSYEEPGVKTPVFYQPSSTDSILQKKLKISLQPAVAIISPDGNTLFKMEGALPEPGKLKDYYQALMKAHDNKTADSVIAAFSIAAKDSAYLVRMIRFIENTKATALPVYSDAGISIRHLLDTLVEKHAHPGIYNQQFYDFVSEKYFPERWMNDYYSLENNQPPSPSLIYLVQHFSRRQRDIAPGNRSNNNSLLMKTQLNLSSAISIAFYGAENNQSRYTQLLALNRQPINGNKPYADFFSSIFYLEKAQGLSKFGVAMNAGYEKDLQDFLVKYAGGSNVTAAAVDAEAKKMFHSIVQDSNQVFLDTYFLNNANEAAYTRTYRTVIGHIITLQAVSTMTKEGDSLLTRDVLQKPSVMKQLSQAADLSALPNHYQLKRNYACALYETGDATKAIALLQEVIKMMEDKSNSYLAGTERIKQAKETLQKMKTGKKINYKILDMISY